VTSGAGEDRQLIAAFLEMMAAEAGAARNTLLAYERDLRGASELLGGDLAPRVGGSAREAGRGLARSEARHRRAQGSGAAPLLCLPARRRACAATILPARLPRPPPNAHSQGARQSAVDLLFAESERRQREEGGAAVLRMSALIELLYGSGLRATELVSMPRHAIAPDRPFLILRGKGDKERLVAAFGPCPRRR
jgi:integrase/recombinase XerD